MNKIIFILTVIISISSVSIGTAQILSSITVDNAQQELKDGAVLVDVRENDELEKLAYYAEGMLHIPLSALDSRMNELPTNKKILVGCRSGSRSAKAIKILETNGYSNLHNLEGGIMAWQAKGYPVVVNGVAPISSKSCCSKSKGNKQSCASKKGDKSCASKAKGKSCGSKKSGKSSCCSKSK